MKIKILSALLMMFTVATTSAKSISQSTELSELMLTLETSASGGASLAYFGFNQDFFQQDLEACKLISGHDATLETMESFEAILDAGDTHPDDYKQLNQAFAAIRNFFGDKQYYRCQKGESVFMGYNSYQRFISTDFEIRVEWVTGHED